MNHAGKAIKAVVLLLLCCSIAHAATDPSPKDLIKAATTRSWPGENYPVLPSISTEMEWKISAEIINSKEVRLAYEKLDASKRHNYEWFDGVAELEKQKAVWSLLSCLSHPSDDVQIRALRSLKSLGDKRAVSFLLIYAEYMSVHENGSENATIHGVIHKEIARTLSPLTGISVTLEGQDPEGLKKGLVKWRKWFASQTAQ